MKQLCNLLLFPQKCIHCLSKVPVFVKKKTLKVMSTIVLPQQ